MSSNVVSRLFELFHSMPDRRLVHAEGKSLSGRELLDAVGARQADMSARGIRAAQRVIVFADRGIDFWVDTMALWGLGAATVPLERDATAAYVCHVVEKAEPDAFVGTPGAGGSALADVREIEARAGGRQAQAPACESVAPGDLAVILFTSGTTGEPKGVMLSHASIAGNARATAERFRLQGRDKMLAPIPFRFVSSLSHFLATLYAGVAYMGVERRLLQAELIDLVLASEADAFGGSPMQARWIAEASAGVDLKIRWLMSSGDNLPVQVIAALRERMPALSIVTAYGLTEVGGRFCILDPELVEQRMGSVGRPIPGLEYTILDDGGRSVAPGESGEVHITGPYVFGGYVNDAEKTRACLSENGFATGDIGYLDDDGFLYLKGRADDVFKSGGVKVSTLPITAALMKTGEFEDVVVVPAADRILGHVPHAYYIPGGKRPLDRGRIMRELRAILPTSHLPRGFTEVDEIPRTGSGKVRRGELQKIIARSSKLP